MNDVCNLFVRYLRYASPFEGGQGDDFQKSSPFVWIPVFFGCATLPNKVGTGLRRGTMKQYVKSSVIKRQW